MAQRIPFRFRPHIAESVPASGARMPQNQIFARTRANPRQQRLSAGRPQGDARGDRAENSFRTALPAIGSRQVFPAIGRIFRDHGRAPPHMWERHPAAKIVAGSHSHNSGVKPEDWLLLSYLKSLLTTKYEKGAKTLSYCLRTKA
jgi:hypothetical protein